MANKASHYDIITTDDGYLYIVVFVKTTPLSELLVYTK